MRKLVVASSALNEELKDLIREKAESYGFTVCFFEDNKDALADAADAEVIYGMGADLAAAGNQLKWFCAASAGVDVYCGKDVFHDGSVLLTNSSGAFGMTIAEHIIMVTLMLLRGMPAYQESVREGRWIRNQRTRSICGSHVTILGTGNLGSEAARRFAAFLPASVTGINRNGICTDPSFTQIMTADRLHEVLPETDILVMCLPGTKDTDRIIGETELSLMKKDAVLINVGRGSSLDQEVLLDHLEQGRLLGAALDVFEKEPIPEGDRAWRTPRLLITPHISGDMSLEWTVRENVRLFLEDFNQYANGRPMHRLVDRTRGY